MREMMGAVWGGKEGISRMTIRDGCVPRMVRVADSLVKMSPLKRE